MARTFYVFGIVLIYSIYAIFSSSLPETENSPEIKITDTASIIGSLKISRAGRPFFAYVGIPYATIPERFAESKLVSIPEWTGIKNFTQPGPACPQAGIDKTEDCLNLNVYTPANSKTKDKLPVMVFIHGGGFQFGGGWGFGPAYFMDTDVILVTINYRLGVFGFLSTGDSVVSGNNGLKDQINALKWIKQNIAEFGGNPDLVTIFGESAGSCAVHYLAISPAAKGLFHRAISQSGTVFNLWAFQENPKDNAIAFAKHMNCSDYSTSENILSCLKSKSLQEVLYGSFSMEEARLPAVPALTFVPTAEAENSSNPFLKVSPKTMLKDNSKFLSVDVPWMVGITEDECATMFAGLILSNDTLLKNLADDWDNRVEGVMLMPDIPGKQAVAEKLKKFYFGEKSVSLENGEDLIRLGNDGFMVNGVYKAVKETVQRNKNKENVYLYQYAYHGPLTLTKPWFPSLRDDETQKVGHGDEIVNQFDLEDVVYPKARETIEETPGNHKEFSENLVRLWTSFAIYGEPKHYWGSAFTEEWKPLAINTSSDGLSWYRIDENPQPLEKDPYKERMEFWDELWNDHFLPNK